MLCAGLQSSQPNSPNNLLSDYQSCFSTSKNDHILYMEYNLSIGFIYIYFLYIAKAMFLTKGMYLRFLHLSFYCLLDQILDNLKKRTSNIPLLIFCSHFTCKVSLVI